MILSWERSLGRLDLMGMRINILKILLTIDTNKIITIRERILWISVINRRWIGKSRMNIGVLQIWVGMVTMVTPGSWTTPTPISHTLQVLIIIKKGNNLPIHTNNKMAETIQHIYPIRASIMTNRPLSYAVTVFMRVWNSNSRNKWTPKILSTIIQE